MRIVEAVSVGISAIRSNKMRSLLTMLGIIIGVASVLAMIAIGDGAKEIVRQDAQKLGGANQFFVYRMSYKRVNNRWVRNRSSEYLKYEIYWQWRQNVQLLVRPHRKFGTGEVCSSKPQVALKSGQAGMA